MVVSMVGSMVRFSVIMKAAQMEGLMDPQLIQMKVVLSSHDELEKPFEVLKDLCIDDS